MQHFRVDSAIVYDKIFNVNNNMGMKHKKHLIVKRFKIVKFLVSEGYNFEDIGFIVGKDRSVISRLIAKGEAYKKSVKNMIKG